MSPDLARVASAADQILKTVPEGLLRGEIPVSLYGLGFLGRWVLPRLKSQGIRLVSCFDANMALKGTSADGLPVYDARDLALARPEFVFISARHAVKPVSAMLSALDIAHVSYDAWHVAADFAAFRDIHEYILSDERSKEVLRAVLMTMLTGELEYCKTVCEGDQYFCLPRFRDSDNDIFVDAGAYDGDSAENFIRAHRGVFAKIVAFEPGPRQFADLKDRAAYLMKEWSLEAGRIELINAGLGEVQYTTQAGSANGQLTSFAKGAYGANGADISIVSLDHMLNETRITFLKADVEGMEMAMLKGAQSTIRRDKPKIAVCVYHYPSDIPEIANYLRVLVPEYRFALRHHSPQLMETVLYCWVD